MSSRENSSDSPLERQKSSTTHDFGFIPIPQRLRYDSEKPFHFGIVLNVLFGFASTFTVANLYYCQPLLSTQSTNTAAGWICDRTPIHLSIGRPCAAEAANHTSSGHFGLANHSVISASLTIGLAVTPHLLVFEALSFLVGVVSVTPQILIPLAADLAPPERRATAISVVFSGLLFGILVGRVIAGIIAEFTSWRVVYYFAIGVQYFVLFASYFVIPDYPAKNQDMSYWGILRTMAKFAYTEPILVQACLANLASCACFTNFWVTLTFLLGGPPYFYSTLTIGLFGLIGILGVAFGPVVGRGIDKLIPWYASLAAAFALLVFQAIQVGSGDVSVAAIVVVIMGLDVFRQMLQMSLATSVFSILPSARARLNAVFMLSVFIGQLMGTAAGTQVFTTYGWRPAAALNMGFYVWILGVLLLRGPHCARFTWFGYEGGWEARKSVVDARKNAAEGADGIGSQGAATPTQHIGDPEKGPATLANRSTASVGEKRAALESPEKHAEEMPDDQ